MIYNWLYAFGLVGLGFVALNIHGHYERLDPLSPDFNPDSSDPINSRKDRFRKPNKASHSNRH